MKQFLVFVCCIVIMQIDVFAATQVSANSDVNSDVQISDAEKERLRIEAEKRAHQLLVDSLLDRPEDIPGLIRQGKIQATEIPTPHWKESACETCHTEDSEYASKENLRIVNIEQSCMNCHAAEFDHSYIHPTGIKPSGEKMQAMPSSIKKQIIRNDNKVGCLTCHDVILQCNLESRQKHENPSFFRNGPYMQRADLCFQCHEDKHYQRFNPHEHVDKNGEIIAEKCRVCHAGSIEELKDARSIDEVEFHTQSNLETICWGCHKWKPHPGGQFSFFGGGTKAPNHLVRPSEKILVKINEALEEKNILLPLEPGSGRVFCATCHNPHAKGVIKNSSAATGAGSNKRLRSRPICNNCHTM